MNSLPMYYWSLLCIGAALIFLFVELFVPSAGAFGILGGVLLIVSIVLGFWYHLGFGVGVLLTILVAAPFLISIAVRIWPHTPIGKRILIGDRRQEDVLPKGSHYSKISNQIGRTGVAKTKMYPSGFVLIDGQQFDAVSNGFPIEQGEPVQVVSVDGNRLCVQKIESEPRGDQASTDLADPIATDPIDGTLERDLSPEDVTPQSSSDTLAQMMEDLGIEDFDL